MARASRSLLHGRLPLVVAVVAALAVVAVLAVVRADDGSGGAATGDDDAVATAPLVPGEPNVVVIMADDMTLSLLATMPKTLELVVEPGTTFADAVVTFPNCCPSRATYLSGLYTHNHGVRDNTPPHGGASRFDAATALPVALERAGYDTIHIGKYLNGWGATGDIAPPDGWTRWFGLVDPTTYQYEGYTVSVDGVATRYGTDADDYQTDVLAAEAVAQIEMRAAGDRPFFLSFTPLAPHSADAEGAAGSTAAAGAAPGSGGGRFPVPVAPERYEGAFAGVSHPRSPSYDEADMSDKPRAIGERPQLTESSLAYLQRYEEAEWGALAALDDAVEDIVGALERSGVLDETVVVFTSDNGLFHGEHRIVSGKWFLYEPSVRVPLAIRGPGFAEGRIVPTPTVNADLAPTIAAVAGADLLVDPDGVSLLELVDDGATVDRAILLQNFQRGRPNTTGVRTRGWTYFVHANGERELYDLAADPDQLQNLAGTPDVADVEEALAITLEELRECAGSGCTVAVPDEAAVR